MTHDRDDDMLEQNLATLLAGSEPVAPAPEARTRMRARLLARHGRATRERSPVAMVGWGLIAAAGTAVIVANIGGERGAGRAPAPPAPVAAADPGRIELADGSTARLGAGGKVIARGPRRVAIEGEVFLDVAPGQGTFVVETAQGELAVLGTRFVVTAAADRTTAAVLRGVVALRSGGHEELIRAGEQGEMRRGAAPTRGPAPRLSHLVSWIAESRRRAERPDAGPARSGALVARDPQWQDQEFPLPLAALTVDVHLENQQARVALDQTFHNPQPRTLEGVYKFALPPGAAVSRLAMYVDGRLMESAVVERMAARRIYEDIVYQRRDPALLEQMGASKVSMRIFPLPPKQDKRVVLAYTQPLARTYDDLTLAVPLPDLDQPVGALAMQVKVVGCGGCEITSPSHKVEVRPVGADALVTYAARGERLGDSLVLRVRQPTPAVTVASTIEDATRFVLVRARPDLPTASTTTERPKRWVILDDTSASRGPAELAAQAAMVDRLIDDIDEHDQVMVVAFDATHRRFSTWQDAMAIDRKALATFLATDAGLGETDLAEALAGAVRLLDGQPGYVVYVGDGAATGERRTIDELRDAIAGRATFIGLGIGDGADLTTLGALADATGGVATTIDLGDDLAWRSLDLVASLYTPRLTGLTAAVDGASVDTTALLRARQVAAGEDVEVIVRAPARDDVTSVTLRGQVDGRPWTQTIALGGAARAPGDGGYLPRLWAQRRLEALMTAGDRALAPCAATPCPTDEERAVAAYHARKAEMVDLGTRYFLLSQHTSLIVLENDAMYAQYKVRKGDGRGWASYALPATIASGASAPTQLAPTGATATSDATALRAPVRWRWDEGLLGDLVEERSGAIGFGATGTLGATAAPLAGTGTGSGYGVSGFAARGSGRGGGGHALAGEKAKADVAGGDTRTETKDVADRLSDADAEAEPDPAPVTAALDKAADNKATEVAPSPDPTPLARNRSTSAPRASSVAVSRSDVIGRRGRGNAADPFAWQPTTPSGVAAAGGLFARQQQAESRAWKRGPRLSPMAFNYSGDWRLADLTAWLPGLSAIDFDGAAAALADGVGDRVGTISAAAAARLSDARARLGGGRWRTDAEAEIVVDDRGRFSRRQALDGGIDEVVSYDGATLAYRYPQLGLGADRAVGDREPALYATYLPLVPPRPSYLARFYQVETAGDHDVVLTPIAGGAPRTLTLAADGTIARITDGVGPAARVVLTSERTGDGYQVTAGGRRHRIRFVADATSAVASVPGVDVVLNLPAPTLAQATAAAQAAVGTGAWRHLAHTRAAAALAADNLGALAQVLRDLASAQSLSVGELALVSGAVAYVDAATLERAIGNQAGAIADYLRAGRGQDRRALAVAAAAPGPVGTLAAFRQVLVAREANDRRAVAAAVDALVAREPNHTLRAIAAVLVGAQFAWSDAAILTSLDRLATGPYRNQVRAELARLSWNSRGRADERWIALMEDVDLDAEPAAIDHEAYAAIVNGARGELGWTQALGRWRDRVLVSDRLDHVLAFAAAAAVRPGPELDAALARAAALAGDDADVIGAVVTMARDGGRTSQAQALLDAALARRPGDPALLRLAAGDAALRGDASTAATLLDRAMAAEVDRPVSLTQLRTDYAALIAWRGEGVVRGGADRDAALAAALAAGRDWRAMDPDNAAREEQLGRLLLAADRFDEAWRYLSSPIDRAPREGTSFERAATVLEQTGRLDQAIGLWRRAFAIDATNPTWLQRQAMAELAAGKRDDARATVERIRDRAWHVRWSGVRYWADNALRSL